MDSLRAAQAYRSNRKLCTLSSTSPGTSVSEPCSRYLQSPRLTLSTSTDLFWSFTDSAYNTIFKLLFIGSSAYTIYLMLNDYKPTHDPNIDTFKVQYLVGGSAVLAILFPYQYTPAEVNTLLLSSTSRKPNHGKPH